VLPLLSKSRYLAGRQCPRRLWLECHAPELAAPPDVATQALFEVGRRVGVLARECFPGGVLVQAEHYRHEEAASHTARLLGDPALPAIFEPTFEFDGVRVRVDILQRGQAGGWRLIEVKSSTQVKDEHLPDLAIQHYVVSGCGVRIESDHVMRVNSSYVFDGVRIDPASFFVADDVTGPITPALDLVPDMLAEQKAVVALADEPGISPGYQCGEPWECPFAGHCTAEKPRYWIKHLLGMDRRRFAELTARGIEEIASIPDDCPLTPNQRRAREATRAGRPWVARDVGSQLARVSYPAQFLDFETTAPAIPRYRGTRPYEMVPFQWSLFTVEEGGTLRHREYLCEEDKDPRPELAAALLSALQDRGSVVAYSAAFDLRVIRDLAGCLPDLAPPLLALMDRVVDLLALLRSCYYHPDFLGSYSLKRVVPVMAPDADYRDLEIQDGSIASLEYLNMLSEPDPQARARLRDKLLAYCKRDTWAMVCIWQELQAFARKGARRP